MAILDLLILARWDLEEKKHILENKWLFLCVRSFASCGKNKQNFPKKFVVRYVSFQDIYNFALMDF